MGDRDRNCAFENLATGRNWSGALRFLCVLASAREHKLLNRFTRAFRFQCGANEVADLHDLHDSHFVLEINFFPSNRRLMEKGSL